MGPDSGKKIDEGRYSVDVDRKKNEKRERSITMKIEVKRKYSIATQLRDHPRNLTKIGRHQTSQQLLEETPRRWADV